MIKKNSMLLLGFILGGVIFGGGVYAVTVTASSVSYSNSSSGLSATNVQGAINELYSKSESLNDNLTTQTCLAGERLALLKGIQQLKKYYDTVDTVNSNNLLYKLSTNGWYNGYPKLMTWMSSTVPGCTFAVSDPASHENCMLDHIINNFSTTCS